MLLISHQSVIYLIIGVLMEICENINAGGLLGMYNFIYFHL